MGKYNKYRRLWVNIRQRCFNKKYTYYHRYGGRGITMYSPWVKDFDLFYNYIKILPNYGKIGYSLDRINNNGNYEPGNLRWADKYIQANNRESRIGVKKSLIINHIITNPQKNQEEIANLFKVNQSTVSRIKSRLIN